MVTAAVQQLSLDPCGFLASSSVHFKDMVRAKEELVWEARLGPGAAGEALRAQALRRHSLSGSSSASVRFGGHSNCVPLSPPGMSCLLASR